MTEASDYALRYLPAHLAATGSVARLYQLARDRSFAQRQADSFVTEPKVALVAQQTALSAAAARDDPVAVAEFTIRHVIGLVRLTNESPLDAARSGELNRAWQLADQPHADDTSLWHLLLAWELSARGDTGGCERTLARLLRKAPGEIRPGPYLDQENWRHTVANALVGTLAEHPTATPSAVAARLLPRSQRAEGMLTRRPTAKPRRYDDSDEPRARSADDGLRLALAGDITGARRALNQIPLDGYEFRTRAYMWVLRSLLWRERESAAIALAAELLKPVDETQVLALHRVLALADLAARLAAPDRRYALDLLEEITDAASRLEEAQHRFDACAAIACAELAVTGSCDFRPLVRRVLGSEHDTAVAAIAVSLCGLLAEAGQTDAALAVVADIPEPFWWKSFKHDAYASIARALSGKGELDSAWETASQIVVETWESSVEGTALAARADAFAGIVVAAAEKKDMNRAEKAYEEIVSRGSGADGNLELWNSVFDESYLALLLLYVSSGTSEKVRALLGDHADSPCFEAAARAIAEQRFGDAAEALKGATEPAWQGLALCRLARLAATDAEVLRLASLALDGAVAVPDFKSWVQLQGEIADLAGSAGDHALMARVLAAFDRVAADLVGDRSGGILSLVRTALRYGGLSRIPSLLAAAADWPGAAYGLCDVLADRNEDIIERIIRLVRDVGLQ